MVTRHFSFVDISVNANVAIAVHFRETLCEIIPLPSQVDDPRLHAVDDVCIIIHERGLHRDRTPLAVISALGYRFQIAQIHAQCGKALFKCHDMLL